MTRPLEKLNSDKEHAIGGVKKSVILLTIDLSQGYRLCDGPHPLGWPCSEFLDAWNRREWRQKVPDNETEAMYTL